MKSTDLIKLQNEAMRAFNELNVASGPVRDQQFLAVADESQAAYLASVKSAIYLVMNALADLGRRCESAARIWAIGEEVEAVELAQVAQSLELDPDIASQEERL